MDQVWVIAGSILAALVVIELAVQVALAYFALPLFEKGPLFNVKPTSEDPRAEPVTFVNADGLTLRGGFYHHDDQPARGVIVFCHEYGGNHWSAMNYCEGLWQAGFDVLAFDFRNQGDSDRQPNYEPVHWLTEYEVTDVLGAIDYVAQRPELTGLSIGLFGVSRGGGAALVAAARNAAVESVAVDSAFATDIMMQLYAHRWSTLVVPAWVYRMIPWWHTLLTLSLIRRISQRRRRVHFANVERWLRRLATRDVFFVSGARDSYVLPEVTHKLAELVGPHCPEPWIVPQAKHNMARQQDPENYDRKLVGFFEKMPAPETHVASVLEPSTD